LKEVHVMAKKDSTTKPGEGAEQLKPAEETAEEKERWATAEKIWADLKIITAIGETLRMQGRLQSLAKEEAIMIKEGHGPLLDPDDPPPQLSRESLKTLGKLLIDKADEIGGAIGESL
jgi:hypothetical protein